MAFIVRRSLLKYLAAIVRGRSATTRAEKWDRANSAHLARRFFLRRAFSNELKTWAGRAGGDDNMQRDARK